jgi:hypothetical protein
MILRDVPWGVSTGDPVYVCVCVIHRGQKTVLLSPATEAGGPCFPLLVVEALVVSQQPEEREPQVCK